MGCCESNESVSLPPKQKQKQPAPGPKPLCGTISDFSREGGEWEPLTEMQTLEASLYEGEDCKPRGEIRVALRWKDQGYGNRKGELRFEIHRGGEWISGSPLFNEEKATHQEETRFEVTDIRGNYFFTNCNATDQFRFACYSGCGGGHELYISKFVWAVFYDDKDVDSRPASFEELEAFVEQQQ